MLSLIKASDQKPQSQDWRRQSVKGLPHNHEDSSSDPQHPHKRSQALQSAGTCYLNTAAVETERALFGLGVFLLASVVQLETLGAVKNT